MGGGGGASCRGVVRIELIRETKISGGTGGKRQRGRTTDRDKMINIYIVRERENGE